MLSHMNHLLNTMKVPDWHKISKEISTQKEFLRRVHPSRPRRLPSIMSFLEVFILHYMHRMKNVTLYQHLKKHDHTKHHTCNNLSSLREIYKNSFQEETMNIVCSLWNVKEHGCFPYEVSRKIGCEKLFMKKIPFLNINCILLEYVRLNCHFVIWVKSLEAHISSSFA